MNYTKKKQNTFLCKSARDVINRKTHMRHDKAADRNNNSI